LATTRAFAYVEEKGPEQSVVPDETKNRQEKGSEEGTRDKGGPERGGTGYESRVAVAGKTEDSSVDDAGPISRQGPVGWHVPNEGGGRVNHTILVHFAEHGHNTHQAKGGLSKLVQTAI
ncbi:MAG: hypothetical protein Q9212_006637, partial [Teloschistes hypoglaucus]